VISDDDPPGTAYLSTYLLPGWRSIMFTYASPEHYDEAQPLLNRLANILKYEIEEGG
jgi:hypothetical protein